jgi:ubiquinone biosynthesis protein COQ9
MALKTACYGQFMSTTDSQSAPSDRYRDQLLDAMLEVAAELGWTQTGLNRAAQKAGLSTGQVLLACPNGVLDVLDQLSRRAAAAAEKRLAEPDMGGLKIRQKVRAGVKAYLSALEPHKTAVKRAAGSPANLLTGPKGLWIAADAIWSALGDKSTDANWYTKRMILSGLIGSTLLAWASSDDEAVVDAFLDRRIEDVMKFETFKGKVREAAAKWPNPLDFIVGRKPN